MKYKKKFSFFYLLAEKRRRGSTLSIRREREGLLAARIASLTRDERSSSFQPPPTPTPLFYLRTKAKETKEREREEEKKRSSSSGRKGVVDRTGVTNNWTGG